MQVRLANTPKITPPADWPEDLRQELLRNVKNGCIGRFILSENARVRVWRLDLDPGERLGFHRHVLDYFRVALTAGSAKSLDHHGAVTHFTFEPGQVKHVQFQENEFLLHDMENTGSDPISFMICEHMRSANPPLPIPDHIRVKPRHIEAVHWEDASRNASTT